MGDSSELALFGEDAAAPADPELDGVRLSAYAAVLAYVGEGIALEEALDHAGIAADHWSAIDGAWAEALAKSASSDGKLQSDCDRHRIAATKNVERRLPPLDEDLRAWLAFQRAIGQSEDPLRTLEGLGMTDADLFRLVDHWQARLAAEETLRKEMSDAMAAEAPPMPKVWPELPRLRPETRRGAKHVTPVAEIAQPIVDEPTVVPPVTAVTTVTTVTPEAPQTPQAPQTALSLSTYAELCAVLALRPDRAATSYRMFGLDERSGANEHWAWRVRLDADPSERAEFERAYRDAYYGTNKPAQAAKPSTENSDAPRDERTITTIAVAQPQPLPFEQRRTDVTDVPITTDATQPPVQSPLHGKPLPFQGRRAEHHEDRMNETREPVAPGTPALPFPARKPRLALPAYAALCAELAEKPEEAIATLSRYSMTLVDKRAEDAAWINEFAADPRLRDTFAGLLAQWRARIRGA